MNPRYCAYARANGHTPAEQLAADRAGAKMASFMAFIAREKRAYLAARGVADPAWPIEDHDDFTKFVESRW